MLTSSIDLPLKPMGLNILCVFCFPKSNTFGSRLIIRGVGRPNNFILYLRTRTRTKPVVHL